MAHYIEDEFTWCRGCGCQTAGMSWFRGSLPTAGMPRFRSFLLYSLTAGNTLFPYETFKVRRVFAEMHAPTNGPKHLKL